MGDLLDDQLALILEMIEMGNFSGRKIEVVTDLKISVKVEIDARRREGSTDVGGVGGINDAPRAVLTHK